MDPVNGKKKMDLDALKAIWTELEMQIKKGNKMNEKIKNEIEDKENFNFDKNNENQESIKPNDVGEEEEG